MPRQRGPQRVSVRLPGVGADRRPTQLLAQPGHDLGAKGVGKKETVTARTLRRAQQALLDQAKAGGSPVLRNSRRVRRRKPCSSHRAGTARTEADSGGEFFVMTPSADTLRLSDFAQPRRISDTEIRGKRLSPHSAISMPGHLSGANSRNSTLPICGGLCLQVYETLPNCLSSVSRASAMRR